jgi:hypothetical protein
MRFRLRSLPSHTLATREVVSGTRRHPHCVPLNELPEVSRVVHGSTVRIIVEGDKNVQTVGQVMVDLARLSQEDLAWIAAPITAPVKAEGGPVGGEAPRMVRDTVMEAEGRRRAPEDGIDLIAEPARLTQFDGPAVVTGAAWRKPASRARSRNRAITTCGSLRRFRCEP